MQATIRNHFRRVDPKIFKIISELNEDLEDVLPVLPRDYFFKLCREIIAQQLGNKIAQKFLERFIDLFPNRIITPKALLKFSDKKLRGIGISWAKVSYLKDLANRIDHGEIDLENLQNFNDEEAILQLTKVKGIGNWTAEMFLMFSLGRQDVFPEGDLRLNRAIKKNYKLKNSKKELVKKISEKWSPYRTWASRILWGYLNAK